MSSYVSAALRWEVQTRADGICEYCLIHQSNLAYACTCCNRAKGSDVGSIAASGEFTRFFNPRTDRWTDHFNLRGVLICAQDREHQSADADDDAGADGKGMLSTCIWSNSALRVTPRPCNPSASS